MSDNDLQPKLSRGFCRDRFGIEADGEDVSQSHGNAVSQVRDFYSLFCSSTSLRGRAAFDRSHRTESLQDSPAFGSGVDELGTFRRDGENPTPT
jgi:hypothetical protein